MSAPEVLRVRRFRVSDVRWETTDVFTLVLEPEPGEKMFSFKAGQWVYLHILNPDGSMWARAAFSIATAPSESRERIELAIKRHGGYTARAEQMAVGESVGIQGPFGVFTLREDVSPQVMFAGGIGITPFRSMIRELARNNASAQVTLLFSNRRAEDLPYFEEFRQLARSWPNFHPAFILTGDAPSDWEGERGRLDEAMLKKHVTDVSRGEFLMCGPAPFMDQVRALLEAQGVDVKKRLRKELFG